MAFSKKGSSLTVPTDHEPDRLNRLVASVPEAMRSRRRKGFVAKHVLVEVHGNRPAPSPRSRIHFRVTAPMGVSNWEYGGGRGIRTPEGLHLSGFQDHRHRPLGHPSGDHQ